MENFLENVRDALAEHIQLITRKKASMSPNDIEILCKDLCALEALTRIESGGESYSMDGGSGNSYRRGRAANGRFTSRDSGSSNGYHDSGNSSRYYDGSGNSGYSGHSKKDRMIDNLEQLMDVAQNDQERQFLHNWLERINNS